MGTALASGLVALYAIVRLWRGGWVVRFPHGHGFAPDWAIIRELFRFGLPAGFQGIAMNIGGVFLLAFIGSLAESAAAQAAYAVSYTQLFSFVTWTSIGLMGAAAAVAGQNLGAGRPDRPAAAVHIAARIGVAGAAFMGLLYFFFPGQLLAIFGMHDPDVISIGTGLLRILSVSGLFISAALAYTGGLQGTGDTKSPLYISIVSQVVAAARHLLRDPAARHAAADAHLAGDPGGSHHSVQPQRVPLPPGQVAGDRRGHRPPVRDEPGLGRIGPRQLRPGHVDSPAPPSTYR